MHQSRQENAGDQVAAILDQLTALRTRIRKAGPLATSRIWKAEMQLRKLLDEEPSLCRSAVAGHPSPCSRSRTAVRRSERRLRGNPHSSRLHHTGTHRIYPTFSMTTYPSS